MQRRTFFIDVILPLALPNSYTYRVPQELNDVVQIGKRVIVPFGKGKLYTAIIKSIHETAPKKYEAKYIDTVLDNYPIVNEKQLHLWDWIASYYMCNTGDVMNAALPSGLKLASETKIILSPAFDKEAMVDLTDKEYLIAEALEIRNALTLLEIGEILNIKTIHPIIKALLEKNVILIQEEVKEKYKAKTETFVKLTEYAAEEDNLKLIFNSLEKKAYKQLELLMAFIHLSKSESNTSIKKSILLKSCDAGEAALSGLVKKNVFELVTNETSRLEKGIDSNKIKDLNEIQEAAFLKIKELFVEKDVTLLHGVTSSGKTEIYIKLIEETLQQGKQVLYLLPEIALTTQIINRLQISFGNKVGVYHSKFNENERVEIWNNVLGVSPSDTVPYSVVLGARSSLFLPFSNLGLIIIDEEHDNSYKQQNPAPRYNARDGGIYLAHIHKAKVLLGSATPCIETYYNALNGKYGLVELHKRFGDVKMPIIEVVNVKEEARKKRMKSHFSKTLLDGIQLALDEKEQVILFQNRRGFAPMLECSTCAWVPQCTQCDVSLTYHKASNLLRCHYCGYSIKPPQTCGACGSTELKMHGFGTEKIEEELSIYFPTARIGRMDLDTTRSKFAYKQILHDFEEHNIDVLVGTQMVTKGLDFNNVSLVGVLNADSLISFPDFRAYENGYQLMAQVSGRAGRKKKQGKVIIQSSNPALSVLQQVVANDYITMYNEQLNERKNYHYPPFYRLIKITTVHKNIEQVNSSAAYLAAELRTFFGKRVLGPEFPMVARIRNAYHKTILLKIERESSTTKSKQFINDVLIGFKTHNEHKMVRLVVDVDPV